MQPSDELVPRGGVLPLSENGADKSSLESVPRGEQSTIPLPLPLAHNGLSQLELLLRYVEESVGNLMDKACGRRFGAEMKQPDIEPVREQMQSLKTRLDHVLAENRTRDFVDHLVSWNYRMQKAGEQHKRLERLFRAVTLDDADVQILREHDVDEEFAAALRRAQHVWLRLTRIPVEMQSWRLLHEARQQLEATIEIALDRVRTWLGTFDWTEDEPLTPTTVSTVLRVIQYWPRFRTDCLGQIVHGRQQVLLRELQQQWDVQVRTKSRKNDSLAMEDHTRIINDLLALAHQRLELERERWRHLLGADEAQVVGSNDANAISLIQTLLRQTSDIYAEAIPQRLQERVQDDSLSLMEMHRLEKLLRFFGELLQRVLGSEAAMVHALEAGQRQLFERCLLSWRRHVSPLRAGDLVIPRDLSVPPLLVHQAKYMRTCLEILSDRVVSDSVHESEWTALTSLFWETVLTVLAKPSVEALTPFERCVFLMNTLDSMNEALAPFWTKEQRDRFAQSIEEQRSAYIELALARSLQRSRLGVLASGAVPKTDLDEEPVAPSTGGTAQKADAKQVDDPCPSLEMIALCMRAFEALLFDSPERDWFTPPLISRIVNREERNSILRALASAISKTYRQTVRALTESGAYDVADIQMLHLHSVDAVETALSRIAADVAEMIT
jgi:hypothetical protein